MALFAGIGGGILGSKLIGWRTVCAVEKEPYCREVLLRRQRDGVLPVFPIWDDVRTFDGRPWRGIVDVVTAGFPCQPFSCAGKRRGENDERNLWPDTLRILCEVRPRFALLENVPGLLATRYFGRILGDLAESVFDARGKIVSAADVGAWHLRKRLWIKLSDPASMQRKEIKRDESDGILSEVLADSKIDRREPRRESYPAQSKERGQSDRGGFGPDVADAKRNGLERPFDKIERKRAAAERRRFTNAGWWESEPDVGRVANGIPFRVDRLGGLGNAQVPAVVRSAWGER